MDNKEFMNQSASEMSIRDLAKAIEIKDKQSSSSNPDRESEFKVGDKVKVVKQTNRNTNNSDYNIGDIFKIIKIVEDVGNEYRIEYNIDNYIWGDKSGGMSNRDLELVKYPIIFEEGGRKVEVRADGSMRLSDGGNEVVFRDALSGLYKAVEKSKELRGK